MLNLWRWGSSSWAIILKIAIRASVSVSNHPSEAKDAQRDGANGLEEQTSTKIRIVTCFYLVRAPTNPANASIYLVLQDIVLTTLRCQASITQLVSVVIPLWISITAGLKLNMLCFQLQNLDWEILFQQGGDNSSGTKLWNCTGGWLPRLLNTRTWKNITLCPTCKVCAQTNKLEFGDTCKSVWSPWSFYPSVSSHVHTDATRSFQISDTLWKHAVAASSHEFHPLKLLQGFQYSSMQSILVHTWNVISILYSAL